MVPHQVFECNSLLRLMLIGLFISGMMYYYRYAVNRKCCGFQCDRPFSCNSRLVQSFIIQAHTTWDTNTTAVWHSLWLAFWFELSVVTGLLSTDLINRNSQILSMVSPPHHLLQLPSMKISHHMRENILNSRQMLHMDQFDSPTHYGISFVNY